MGQKKTVIAARSPVNRAIQITDMGLLRFRSLSVSYNFDVIVLSLVSLHIWQVPLLLWCGGICQIRNAMPNAWSVLLQLCKHWKQRKVEKWVAPTPSLNKSTLEKMVAHSYRRESVVSCSPESEILLVIPVMKISLCDNLAKRTTYLWMFIIVSDIMPLQPLTNPWKLIAEI